jgi:hypothetical protein
MPLASSGSLVLTGSPAACTPSPSRCALQNEASSKEHEPQFSSIPVPPKPAASDSRFGTVRQESWKETRSLFKAMKAMNELAEAQADEEDEESREQ